MKKVLLFVVFLTMVGLYVAPVCGAESLWVTSEGAKLKADSSASSRTVSNLVIGTKLTVLESQSRWYRVQTVSGEEGWIYRGKVSDAPPEKEAEDTGNLFAGLQGSNISADEAQTSRSIRGLSKETEQYAKKQGTPKAYQEALDQVLAIRVTPQEIDVFLRNGKIGEYAQ